MSVAEVKLLSFILNPSKSCSLLGYKMWSPGVEAGDGPPSSLREEEELKDQFQQQQEKIAELKELLKQNEQKLVNKEKEVEVNISSLIYKI